MTQLEHAGRRTTVLTSTIVAAAVSTIITVSGLLVVPSLSAAPAPQTDSASELRLDRAIEAGRAWQRQRLAESPVHYERLHLAEQAGLEWQVRSELTNPNDR